ncbi:MAG: activator of (R)-2-hydroxyglutaryl-CoA dehydratase [Bacteroidia bacterium]|nr:activator of (R)-2-hydroxyglutaryl-CoA dehydratase [Bacteroidia bacterium]
MMHDSVRNTRPRPGNDHGIDPAILDAIRSGAMTIGEALERERERLASEKGLTRDGVAHWNRPTERAFTRKEREHTTVLFGGLTWKHERLIQANLRRLGYKAEYLPAPDGRAYEKGKEFSNNGLCNPTYFTVGCLIAYLQDLEASGLSRTDIIDSYIFFTAGACGPCRFGMYESEYRLALRNAGFDGFRVLILQQQGGLDQTAENAGLEMNLDFTLGIVNAFVLADVLNDLAYRTRPYERTAGATDRALEAAMEHVARAVETLPVLRPSRTLTTLLGRRTAGTALALKKFRRHIFGQELLRALREARTYFTDIETDRTRVKPLVKITGEFWAQTTEGDGNFRMFRFLEQEGAEVLIEPITPWLLYLLHQEKQARRDRRLLDVDPSLPRVRKLSRKAASLFRYAQAQSLLTLAEYFYAREYRRYRRAMHDIPQSLPDQYHFSRIASRYFNTRIEGGEGHLEVAKTIYYSENALCHMMLSLKPFGCLPSTQSDGVQSAVVAHHKDILFLPIETSGEGEINAQSRVQMMLADARERARDEFERALADNCLSVEALREAMEHHPELRSAFLRLPPDGKHAGTAARFVRHVAALSRRTAR